MGSIQNNFQQNPFIFIIAISVALAAELCFSITADFYDVPFCRVCKKGNLFAGSYWPTRQKDMPCVPFADGKFFQIE